ncbi:LysM peptidoglycan-binding domain-containing protein [Candidatus Pelagibacter sp.]|uniref:LysM peptidoglycan-binding domain-containing protein n=1 Tax=Candidatus Pelagibacter sp. TaxID=2024849 RepID=UPI003F82DB53
MKYLYIIILVFFNSKLMANDPFTNDIGLIKEPEPIVEEVVEEVVENQDTEILEEILVEETTEIIEIVENVEVTEPKEETGKNETDTGDEIITVLNIDPMVAYTLNKYTLKGTALSKKSVKKFKREKIKKYDSAKIPTTHTIEDNETIEKIAFMYGFSLREIELANGIYPGSRKLVKGDKLVIPNRIHIVKEGQTINSISKRYNINPIQLASYNDITDDEVVLIGDKLLLPFFIHVTNDKETLSDIAARYERETMELIEFNEFDQNTLVLNENQLIKIPIYAYDKIEYNSLSKKSINDFKIDRKNLAIIEIDGGQYMVREGDRIGNKDGVIVSIETTKMLVLEENIEYEFLINTPIVGQAIASLPQTGNTDLSDATGTAQDDISDETSSVTDGQNNDNGETITNVEELFN